MLGLLVAFVPLHSGCDLGAVFATDAADDIGGGASETGGTRDDDSSEAKDLSGGGELPQAVYQMAFTPDGVKILRWRFK